MKAGCCGEGHGHHGHHGREGGCDCGGRCGCGGHGRRRFHRRFKTKTERIAELEAYRTELRAELAAVDELLADLGK